MIRKLIIILLLGLLAGCGYGRLARKDGVTSGFYLGFGKLTETSIESNSPIKDIINVGQNE